MATKQKTAEDQSSKKASQNSVVKQNKKQNVKKSQDKQPGSFKRFGSYLKDVRHELHRVVWPTRSDVLNYTMVVLATLIFFGIFIYIIDSLIIPLFVAFAGLR